MPFLAGSLSCSPSWPLLRFLRKCLLNSIRQLEVMPKLCNQSQETWLPVSGLSQSVNKQSLKMVLGPEKILHLSGPQFAPLGSKKFRVGQRFSTREAFSIPLVPRGSGTSLVVHPWLDTQLIRCLLVSEMYVGCWILLWLVELDASEQIGITG